MLSRLRTVFRGLTKRSSWERDLDDELQAHLEHRTADLIEQGLPPTHARRQARIELGSSENYKEQCRDAHGLRWADELRQDLLYSARTMLRSPGFTLVAVLSLALGLGANTVVFGVLNALLFSNLPVDDPQSVVVLQNRSNVNHSFPNYRTLRDRNSTFTDLAAVRISRMGLGDSNSADVAWGFLVTTNYFKMLGLEPALGRFFEPQKDPPPGSTPTVVLSYRAWQNRFQSDPDIAGKAIRINKRPYTVLGVAPEGFHGTELFFRAELWIPLAMLREIEGSSWLNDHATTNIGVLGRLAPGVSPEHAAADLNLVAESIKREHPAWNDALSYNLAAPGLMGDSLRAPIQAFGAGVMALACLALLVACANLASLLGARTSDRLREIAIRTAVGAGRARIVRQLLTEALALTLVGGLCGWAIAAGVLSNLGDLGTPLGLRILLDLQPDLRVFAFGAAVSLLTGVLVGVAPLRGALRTQPRDAFSSGRGGTGDGRRRPLRDLLLAVQVAACCVLVTAGLLAFDGLQEAASADLGFEPDGVAAANFDLSLAGYDASAGKAFQRRALQRARAIPGVTEAAFANSTPLSLDQSTTSLFPGDVVDLERAPSISASYYEVSPGALSALGIPLLEGRDFTWRDDADSHRVGIINQTLADRLFPDGDAVGRLFHHGRRGDLVEVVGVVAPGKYQVLAEDPRAAVFWPASQRYNSASVLLARSSRAEAEVARDLRTELTRMDPAVPLFFASGLRQQLGFQLIPAQVASIALGAFGGLALMLVVTGIYGLASYSVSRRLREIGIRTAIGASRSDVLRTVLGRTALLVVGGAAAGLALGQAASEVLGRVVYHSGGSDLALMLAAATVMALTAMASASAPAWRALKIHPSRVLRED